MFSNTGTLSLKICNTWCYMLLQIFTWEMEAATTNINIILWQDFLRSNNSNSYSILWPCIPSSPWAKPAIYLLTFLWLILMFMDIKVKLQPMLQSIYFSSRKISIKLAEIRYIIWCISMVSYMMLKYAYSFSNYIFW